MNVLLFELLLSLYFGYYFDALLHIVYTEFVGTVVVTYCCNFYHVYAA